ncbi:MAG: type II toxin-antitoxin system RelE/ParE family toxin [Blastocatellales bacterium]
MHIFKTKEFSKWASKGRCSDAALRNAVDEMESGLHNGNLGGNVYKKRVGVQGRGKSGGLRTLIAFKQGDKTFFIYGFAKNERANISETEEKALKLLAKELLGYSDAGLVKAVKAGELIEVRSNEKDDS